MQRKFLFAILLTAVAWLLLACGAGSEGDIRKTVDDAAQAATDGLNRRNLSRAQSFFSSEAEGANATGLANTLGALQAFAQDLTPGDRVQLHSFDVQDVNLHEDGNLARASYRLHMSVLRGSQVVFGFVATQNLALTRIKGKWLISGGDEAQLSEVLGQWPLPGPGATP